MSERIYNIVMREVTPADLAKKTIVFFTILIGAIGISRVWFGGAWVIDICALVIAFAVLALLPKRVVKTVKMTKTELRVWVVAGCPDNWGREDEPTRGEAS